MSAITVRISRVRGSAPREVGAFMVVTSQGQDGTIGGGTLEFEATRRAREMIASGVIEAKRTYPLGPDLGQCCGGAVTLEFSADVPRKTTGAPIWIWGAGHVGRALVDVLHPLPDFAITWADTGPERFPEHIPAGVSTLPAKDLTRLMAHAPRDAHHIIVTYSHDIDLDLCDAALRRGFATCGLIGSATKWARFSKRLRERGHGPDQIAGITCPIGDPSLGKHPHAIALGVAARYLRDKQPETAGEIAYDRCATEA